MRSAYRVVAVSAIVAAASLVIRADVTPPSQAAEIQLQLGDILFSEGKYLDSLDAYRNALKSAPSDSIRRPRMGSSRRRCAWRSSSWPARRPKSSIRPIPKARRR